MLAADGLCSYLDQVPRDTLDQKRVWGTNLHEALLFSEHGYDIQVEFKEHRFQWLKLCRQMKWGPSPVWENAERPALAQYQGFVFGFIPDRAAPEAVVEIKGTANIHVSHEIQTALQVIGMGYPRTTPRYVCYFDKDGLKKLVTCGKMIIRDGQKLNVYVEANRIIFEHALEWNGEAL
jgi:hypothetical protein